MPLLDNNILNEFNDQQFEIDNFFNTGPSSNESDCLPEFVSISQNCSFDSISVDNSSSLLNDSSPFNSSASSSTSSEAYSPIQITPPETPPSSETSQTSSKRSSQRSSQSNGAAKVRRASSKSKKSKNEQADTHKKKKLLPLAPKTESIAFVQLNGSPDRPQKFIQISQPKLVASNLNQITATELLKLNNNSLNFNLNNNQNIIKVPAVRGPLNAAATQNSPDPQTVSLIDEKLSKEEMSKIKEKARRLRNRQSAMMSRQKKLEYVKGIEKRLEEVTDENKNLKKENHSLKDLVGKLTFENNQLKSLQGKMQSIVGDYSNCPLMNGSSTTKQGFPFSSSDTSKAKKTISLLAVIFLIGLNMNLYNDNFRTYDQSAKKLASLKANENVFKGRVLLWSDNLDAGTTNNGTTNCSSQYLISKNETLILESKLRNWAILQNQNSKQHLNFANDKLDAGVRRSPWYFGVRNWNQLDETNKQREKSYYSNELNYEQIIASVKPKDDTYYFVSLNSADHLILPLNFYSNSSRNGLFRPKFSLLLPALQNSPKFGAGNATSTRNATKEFSNSFLQLIEIDFEVINMKPIQILKNRVHHHLQTTTDNNRFKQIVRSTLDKQTPPPNAILIKPLKSILSKNQTTNVQSQFQKSTLT